MLYGLFHHSISLTLPTGIRQLEWLGRRTSSQVHRLQSAELRWCIYKHLSRPTHLSYAAASTDEAKPDTEEEGRHHAHVQCWFIVSRGPYSLP